MKKILLLGLLSILAACGHIDASLSEPPTIYHDVPVRKSSLQVSIHPKGKEYRPLTAYIPPFIIQQPNSDYRHLANTFAEIFHYAWTEERLFPTQELRHDTLNKGMQEALAQARFRGADLLVLGYAPYFYAGHTLDDTAITIAIKIYSTESGELLWDMIQSGRIAKRETEDYIVFQQAYRMSEGPFNKIIRAIAKDMALPLKGWLPTPDSNYPFAANVQEVKANLTAEPLAPAPLKTSTDQQKIETDLPPETTAKQPSAKEVPSQRPQVKGVNLDIHFKFDNAIIDQESYTLLDSVGQAMTSPELTGKSIIIAGHTDATGSELYNLNLSKKRAQAVKEYLVSKWNIAPETMQAVGYGQSRPLTTGKTAADLKKNRRVEIRLAE